MGVHLVDGGISDFEECVRKGLLAYVKYPENGEASLCFAYPQFLIDGDGLTLIEKEAFPDDGCLPMSTSGYNSGQIRDLYGDMVVAIVNSNSLGVNNKYPIEKSQFFGALNPNKPRGASPVEFTPLSKHPLSGALIQVLEIQENVDFSKPLEVPVHIYPDQAAPRTKLSLIAQVSKGKKRYFGPFECNCKNGEEVFLSATGSFDACIAGFDEASFAMSIDLVNDREDIVAQFVDADEVRRKFDDADDVIDWISDEALVEAIGRVSRSGADSFTKAQMQSLKSQILTCADESAKIPLTPSRRLRMKRLLGMTSEWSSLPDEIKDNAIKNADPNQLARYVLSDDHFRSFYEKVMENDGVREKVRQEKDAYRSQIAADEDKARLVEAELRRVKAELSSYEGALEEKKKQVEGELADQLEQIHQERAALLSEKESLADEVAKLNVEKSELEKTNLELEENNILVRRQIRRTVGDMSDELSVSSKILENEMIRQIVSSINSDDASRAKEESEQGLVGPGLAVVEGAFGSPIGVLEEIERRIGEYSGRDISRNEIVNLMVCLMQGYIVTLAGLPGTGKTSLVNIIAAALGLKNSSAYRFAEVPVEKGWTSYKDFIGYYNPFTKSLEKANKVAFDAFGALDSESRLGLGPSKVSPYLLLLDEANLSSVEHYWSPFLGACDSFKDGPYELGLGGETVFSVPEYMRFVATVNFDHTTEELSPRFLDRSWIVMCNPVALDIDEVGRAVEFPDMPAFSYADLIEAFGVREKTTVDGELRGKLEKVVDVFAKNGRPISPRSQKMMFDYVRTASEFMNCSSSEEQYSPVDYAVLQKALPLISGADGRIRELLDELRGIPGLPMTEKRIDRMIEVGDDNGFYQYFA